MFPKAIEVTLNVAAGSVVVGTNIVFNNTESGEEAVDTLATTNNDDLGTALGVTVEATTTPTSQATAS